MAKWLKPKKIDAIAYCKGGAFHDSEIIKISYIRSDDVVLLRLVNVGAYNRLLLENESKLSMLVCRDKRTIRSFFETTVRFKSPKAVKIKMGEMSESFLSKIFVSKNKTQLCTTIYCSIDGRLKIFLKITHVDLEIEDKFDVISKLCNSKALARSVLAY